MSDTGVFRQLLRTAGPQPSLLVAAQLAESAQALADQFGFLSVAASTAGWSDLPDALDGVDSPLALALVASTSAAETQQVLDRVAAERPELPLVVFTASDLSAFRKSEQVVATMTTPTGYSELAELVRKLRLIEAHGGPRAARADSDIRSLVGRSAGIQAVRRMIMRVAPWEATVQLVGETGTGKEVVARNLHYHSARRHGPFVAVNCGAIPSDLLESELFGHEKGAFTGALAARAGRFELAAGGTLFLDEIGDMPLDMQVKLLRVLQERRFERLGSAQSIDADVRIIAATHQDLEALIQAGRFREDLYYRLNVVPIEVPPLRERREDLPLLIAELNARLQRCGMPMARFDAPAAAAMVRYDWPGNVRELANVVERCAILSAEGDVSLSELPYKLQALVPDEDSEPETPADGLLDELGLVDVNVGSDVGLKTLLENIEVRLIGRALESADGVVAQAAKTLGLRRTTLVEKMRKFGIERVGGASEF